MRPKLGTDRQVLGDRPDHHALSRYKAPKTTLLKKNFHTKFFFSRFNPYLCGPEMGLTTN